MRREVDGAGNCRMLLVLVAVALAGVGCATSAHESNDDAAMPPRPIDRVRAGIVSVEHQFGVTTLAAQATNRARFRKELGTLENSVAQLRADAADLRERASEYLALWSGEIVTITTAGGVHGRVDERRARVKAKYDEMVTQMQQARDQATPLIAEFKQLEQRQQVQPLGSDSQHLSEDSARVRALLKSALEDLDQLTAMLNQTTR